MKGTGPRIGRFVLGLYLGHLFSVDRLCLVRIWRRLGRGARTEEVWRKIREVRYLVQDKPAGVMPEFGFMESLRWLGREGLSFDWG